MALLLNAGDTVSRSYSYTQPSPLHPSQPNGTGERTENLYDYKIPYTSYLQSDGTVIATSYQFYSVKNYFTNDMIGKTLTITVYINSVGNSYVFLSAVINGTRVNSTNRVSAGASGILSLTVTPTSTNDYWQIPYGDGQFSIAASQFMVNFGSAPLSYEPYGYKIPISSANTTTNIYLGEVPTTRRIKKLVLDGTENWYTAVSSTGLFGVQRFEPMHAHPFIPGYSAISNCYVYNPVQSGIDAATVSGEFALQAFRTGSTWQYNFFIKDGRYDNINSFTSYLAAQYAAGTPVTIWYVLATETTGIVNEPIRKIGNYADSVSGITIPTIAGVNTLSIGTTLQPSEVTVNYKGWHPVADVHERDNGAWT